MLKYAKKNYIFIAFTGAKGFMLLYIPTPPLPTTMVCATLLHLFNKIVQLYYFSYIFNWPSDEKNWNFSLQTWKEIPANGNNTKPALIINLKLTCKDEEKEEEEVASHTHTRAYLSAAGIYGNYMVGEMHCCKNPIGITFTSLQMIGKYHRAQWVVRNFTGSETETCLNVSLDSTLYKARDVASYISERLCISLSSSVGVVTRLNIVWQ